MEPLAGRAKVDLSDAVEMAAAERADFLDEATAGDAACGSGSRLCSRPTSAREPPRSAAARFAAGLGRLGSGCRRRAAPAHHRPLQAAGADRRGGMGVVYMAEQTQPVRRKVALKVIKPGMDTRQVIARFEAERQALALMDHPNIARVLDAGSDRRGPAVLRDGAGHGRADHRVLRRGPALDPRAAGAVRAGLPGGAARPPEGDHPPRPQADEHPGHAARRRAGAEGDRLRRRQGDRRSSSPTRRCSPASRQMVGTPLYMSPEQAEMTGLDVDTRSDIYAWACCSTSC